MLTSAASRLGRCDIRSAASARVRSSITQTLSIYSGALADKPRFRCLCAALSLSPNELANPSANLEQLAARWGALAKADRHHCLSCKRLIVLGNNQLFLEPTLFFS